MKIKTALISVSDKTNIVTFAEALHALNITIISTGGTAKTLKDAGIPVILVSELTGFPEIMDGRVKTLHPNIHGGILGKRNAHQKEAAAHKIRWIDCVVCNLYPFSTTVASHASFENCIEQIDIGGPSMIRSAAKNMQDVTVIHDPNDYASVIAAIKNDTLDFAFRKKLAAKAFAHTANYDAIIADYLNEEKMPEHMSVPFKKIADCRYGENPHQQAAVYRNLIDKTSGILDATLLQGKQLSYNNYNDAANALTTILGYHQPACVVVKHANPCGAAIADDIDTAFQKAWEADSVSAFGGIVAINRPCTEKIAAFLTSVFIEVIIAPDFTKEALILFSKKPNVRVLKQDPWPTRLQTTAPKWIAGGLLWQTADHSIFDVNKIKVVTKIKPTDAQLLAMKFSWPILKSLKSNAILITNHESTIGVGMGQVSRIDAVELALKKAAGKCDGAILASDAFFPFADSIERIAQTPIKAIVQPGGSIKDQEVIAACDAHDIAMVFTGERCFNH